MPVVTHTFVDAHADGADTTLVRPSNWNANHTVVLNLANLVTPSVQASVVGNPASTLETTLLSYVLPANSITTVGHGLKINAAGFWGTNASRAIIKVYFGSDVLTIDQPTTNGSRWNADMTVVMAAASPQQVFVSGRADANFPVGPYGNDPTINLTTTVLIKVTGQSPVVSVANQAVVYQLLVAPLDTDLAAAIIAL